MRVDKGIPVRLVLYTLAVGYLILDLVVIKGPLWRHFRDRDPSSPEAIAAAKAEGVVARIYNYPILLTQVERRLEEDLWKEGRRPEDLSEAELKLKRRVALDTLIDLHLLGKVKVHYNRSEYPVSTEEIDAAVERFVSRFANPTKASEALAGQGWTEEELRARLAARIQQEKYLEDFIGLTITEEEVGEWYDQHREELAYPERLRVRHIFRATLDRDASEVRTEIDEIMAKLTEGGDFGELAAEFSQDERSKKTGGDLGWMRAERLPKDFADSVFDLPLNKVTLVQTKLGWHLVEVMERRDPEERTLEEAREEIVAALEAEKRIEGLRLYRRQLREFEKLKVEVFTDVLDGTYRPSGGRPGGEGR